MSRIKVTFEARSGADLIREYLMDEDMHFVESRVGAFEVYLDTLNDAHRLTTWMKDRLQLGRLVLLRSDV